MITRVFLFDHLRDVLAPGVKANVSIKSHRFWATREGILSLFANYQNDPVDTRGVVVDVDFETYNQACWDLYGACYDPGYKQQISTAQVLSTNQTIYRPMHYAMVRVYTTMKLPFNDYATLNGEHNYTIEVPVL